MSDIEELYDLAVTCRDRGTVLLQPEQAEAILRVLLMRAEISTRVQELSPFSGRVEYPLARFGIPEHRPNEATVSNEGRPITMADLEKATELAKAAPVPFFRQDQHEYERKSPRSTVNDLAEQWVNGEEEARSRLRNMLVTNARFDARDRSALAYLLVKEKL